jgi:hypothetical protein
MTVTTDGYESYGGNFAVGFQTPPDRRAVMTVTTDGYETSIT